MKLIGNVTATINGQPIEGLRSVSIAPRLTLVERRELCGRNCFSFTIKSADWQSFQRGLWHATIRNRPGRYWKRRRLPGRYRKP